MPRRLRKTKSRPAMTADMERLQRWFLGETDTDESQDMVALMYLVSWPETRAAWDAVSEQAMAGFRSDPERFRKQIHRLAICPALEGDPFRSELGQLRARMEDSDANTRSTEGAVLL